MNDKDAIVIGAGPNGLAAAITLARAGLSVILLERDESVGGSTQSAELTLPGFIHDRCSTVHAMANVSPFFAKRRLRGIWAGICTSRSARWLIRWMMGQRLCVSGRSRQHAMGLVPMARHIES